MTGTYHYTWVIRGFTRTAAKSKNGPNDGSGQPRKEHKWSPGAGSAATARQSQARQSPELSPAYFRKERWTYYSLRQAEGEPACLWEGLSPLGWICLGKVLERRWEPELRGVGEECGRQEGGR